MEQIQYCAKFPRSGLRVDRVRIDSVSFGDWQAMCRLTVRYHDYFPVLSDVLACPLGIEVLRQDLSAVQEEIERFLATGPAHADGSQQLLPLSLFVDQVLDQADAVASIEHWPGRYFEGQVFIFPGTDLLARLRALPANQGRAVTAG